MDPDVPPAALRISLLQILDGLGALDVQAKLGVSRATYYAGHRRAGQARGGEVGRTKAQGGIVLRPLAAGTSGTVAKAREAGFGRHRAARRPERLDSAPRGTRRRRHPGREHQVTSAIVITAAERDQLLAQLRRLEQLATPDTDAPESTGPLRVLSGPRRANKPPGKQALTC